MNKPSLIRRFFAQPLSVCIVEIWLVFVVFVLSVQFPWFILSFFVISFTVFSIMYLIMYFATKGDAL